MQRQKHAVIIGSGFGGLAAAIRLGARGYAVTVLERRDQPGGRAYVYRKDGFTFDGGPTVVTAPQLFKELWQLAGGKLEDDIDLRPVHPFYAIRFADGTWFEYSGDGQSMSQQIAALEPRDVDGYDDYLAMSERIFNVGFERLADVPFGSWATMARIAPSLIRLKSYKTVYSLVSSHVRNEKLRQVLSFHTLLVGGNPFSTTSIYSLISFLERKWGVHYAMGGTGSLVDGLVRLIEAHGGSVRLGADVASITVTRGRADGVVLRDGERVDADLVVSNADSAWTYRHLVPRGASKRWTDRRLERMRYSMSLFVWYFGTSRQYPDVAHHSILLGPRYKELLDDIFVNKKLSRDFSLYLHRPTATDPSMAPSGCDAFYVLSPVPHLDGEIDWGEQAEPYRAAIAQFLSKTLLPDLERHVVTSHVVTPRHFEQELLSYKGAAFGIEPSFNQSAYFRPHNASEDIERLYLVGAGTHPGAGLPGVLSSAKVLDRVVPDADLIGQ